MKRAARFMALALKLARKGAGFASPNPMVGAVVVRGGKVVSTGYHARHGEEHAEAVALRKAGRRARGATMYVSLEPCCHWGLQPPCTLDIIAAGVKKVVYALRDPNPLVGGKGRKELARAGIRVEGGLLAEEARELNRAYFKRMEKGLPYVVLKVAMSADGKISGQKGKWIGGPQERKEVQRLRARSDAVMVGIRTVLKDDPRLTARVKDARQPLRVVLDSRLRLPLKARLLREKGSVLVLTTRKAPAAKRKKLEKKGAEVVRVKEQKSRVDLKAALRELGKRKVNQVLVEGGQKLSTALLAQGLVDELCLAVSPKAIGAKGLDAFDFRQLKEKQVTLRKMEWKKLGKDWLVRARLG